MKVIAVALAAATGVVGLKLNLNLGANVNKWNYGDPQTGCQSTEQNVSVTGLTGDFCSPPCDSSNNCPTTYPPGVTAQGQCVLEMPGNNQPTYCALICDPNTKGTCGKAPAKCEPIQGVGVCTYPIGK